MFKPTQILVFICCTVCVQVAKAADVLVADRLSNSVYRYSQSGTLLGTVVTDNTNINQAVGLALSPDRAKLYVSSAQNNRVMRYDYDYETGTATNPAIFADASDGLAFPNAILFGGDGSKIYVSNLGGSGVAQFNTNGLLAGPAINGLIGGGSIFQFSGLAHAPGGELLVGGFQDFPAGTSGAIAKSNTAISSISTFIGPSTSLNGTSGLLVNGNDLYVTGMFASNIQRFNATTGAVDPSFSVTGLAFPQGLMAAPDGNGFLVGILGIANGQGRIARYSYDGGLLGTFASPGGGGFTEATAFVTVPDPLPGDFDLDWDVDGADFVAWQTNFPKASGASLSQGDADDDGDVDGADFVVWQTHFPTPGSPASTVPEPASFLLAMIAAIVSVRTLLREKQK